MLAIIGHSQIEQSSKRSGRPPIRPFNPHNHGSKRRGQISWTRCRALSVVCQFPTYECERADRRPEVRWNVRSYESVSFRLVLK